MKIFLIVIAIFFLYLRNSIDRVLMNIKINKLLGFYHSYNRATSHEEKVKAFQQIVESRPLSYDLVSSFYFSPPSYNDFGNDEKIRDAYLMLCETFDDNHYWAKKHLRPKYFIKDIFLLPSAILSFLLNRKFEKLSSLFLSCLAWLATILISAYATEIRNVIELLINKFI